MIINFLLNSATDLFLSVPYKGKPNKVSSVTAQGELQPSTSSIVTASKPVGEFLLKPSTSRHGYSVMLRCEGGGVWESSITYQKRIGQHQCLSVFPT